MKRRITALLMGTALSATVCSCGVQAMTYAYDMGGEIFISGNSSFSDLPEKEMQKLSDRHLDTCTAIQMPEGEIDVYTVRGDNYRLTGVRIASQEEYGRPTRQMEAMEAAARREASFTEKSADAETGSIIHTFTYDEETVTEPGNGSAVETAVVAE